MLFKLLISLNLTAIFILMAVNYGGREAWSGWAGGALGSLIGVFFALYMAFDQLKNNANEGKKRQQEIERIDVRRRCIDLSHSINRLYDLFNKVDLNMISFTSFDFDTSIMSIREFNTEFNRRINICYDNLSYLSGLHVLYPAPEDPILAEMIKSIKNECYEVGELLEVIHMNYSSCINMAYEGIFSGNIHIDYEEEIFSVVKSSFHYKASRIVECIAF